MTLIEQLNPLINIILALISGGSIAAVLNYMNRRKEVAAQYDLGVRTSETEEENSAFQQILTISQEQEKRVAALEGRVEELSKRLEEEHQENLHLERQNNLLKIYNDVLLAHVPPPPPAPPIGLA